MAAPTTAPPRPTRSTPAPPRALPAALPVALAVLALSVAAYLLLASTRPGVMWWLGDLRVYRDGGATALHHPAGLYDLTVGRAHLPFTYPPGAALAFAPLSTLPWGVLTTAWTAAGLALLATTAHLAWGLAGRRGRPRAAATALTTAVLLWTDPVQETLRFGQINLALAALVLWDLSRPGTSRTKGLGTGLAAALKLTPAVFALLLLVTGRRRAAARAAAAFAAVAALGWALLPHASARYWSGLFLDSSRVGSTTTPGNQSLLGLLTRVLHDAHPPTAAWAAVAVPVAALGLLLARAADRDGRELTGVCLTALTGLLVSPISWTHHWVWVVPCAVALADLALRTRGAARAAAWAATAATCALAAAPPAHRSGLPSALPTGWVWHVPYGNGRELHLPAAGLVTGDAYVLAALTALSAVAVVAAATTRRSGPRSSPPAPAPPHAHPSPQVTAPAPGAVAG